MVNLIKKIGVPLTMVSALALPMSSLAENFKSVDTSKTDTNNSVSVFYHKNSETTTPSFMKLDFSRKIGGLWRLGIESEYLDRNRNASVLHIVGLDDKIKLDVGTYIGPSFDLGNIEFIPQIGLEFDNLYYRLDKTDVDLFYKLELEVPIKSGYKFYFSTKDSFFENHKPSFGIGLKIKF
jgi:hypothetical protein